MKEVMKVAHTPDPDDAYAWWALATGRIRIGGFGVEVETSPIQVINQRCLDGEYDVAAISSAVYPRLAGDYAILASGASVGRGYGPALASMQIRKAGELRPGHRVAVPGHLTTGALLLRLFFPRITPVAMRCDAIAGAILKGTVDAGVLIHEELMNWEARGLRRIACLGQRWQSETGLPIPVGLNVVHRRWGREMMEEAARKIRLSMDLASQRRAEALEWAMRFSHESRPGISDRFIAMFANEDTLDLKPDCCRALRLLYRLAKKRGLIDNVPHLDIIRPSSEECAAKQDGSKTTIPVSGPGEGRTETHHQSSGNIGDKGRCAGPLLLTGATGFLGFSLLCEARRRGEEVYALVRPRDGRSGGERLRERAEICGHTRESIRSLMSGVRVLAGDLTRNDLGLEAVVWREAVERVSRVVHTAAFVDFVSSEAAVFERINVEGTRNVLEFARQAGAAFHHISTAYLHGLREGTIMEDAGPEVGRPRNLYEQTKQRAESLVQAWTHWHGLPTTIFRPSILMGEFESGAAASFKNFYQFMRLLDRQAQAGGTVLNLLLPQEATLNLVPVDYAARTIWQILQSPASGRRTFHITHPDPPTMAELAEFFRAVLGVKILLGGKRAKGEPEGRSGRWDQATRELLRHYRDYIQGEPRFDLKNTCSRIPHYRDSFPRLGAGYFERLFDFARRSGWGKNRRENPSKFGALGSEAYIAAYFNDFLAEKLYRPLLTNLHYLSCRFGIRIRDAVDSDWALEICRGRLVSISREMENVDCCYHTDFATFQAIARGESSPHQAFFASRVDIDGNMEIGLRTATALVSFFESFPFIPGMVS